jgi:transcriptional regulator with XRE-family HTH domain
MSLQPTGNGARNRVPANLAQDRAPGNRAAPRAASRATDHATDHARDQAPRRATGFEMAGRARGAYVAKRLGIGLRDARLAAGLPQRVVAARAGVSQPEIAKLEGGRGSDTGIDTWAACGAAVGLQLAAFFEVTPGADVPRDIEHLKRQNLVIATSAIGGWHAEPEAAIPGDGPRPRSIDVLLTRAARREAAVVEVWDLVLDGGQVMRSLEAKVLATRERLGADWHVEGLLIVRGTQRNRRLIGGLKALFVARYPASSHAWLRAFRDGSAGMPDAAGLVWTDVTGESLLPARLRRSTR